METPLVTQRGILLRVALPSSPSASLASEAKSVPSCVAFEAQRAKCSMRVRCAFVDVKAALLKGALEVKSVVFKEKEETDKVLKAVVIAVYFKDAPNLDLCTAILNERGYSVDPLPMPNLSQTKTATKPKKSAKRPTSPRSHNLAIQIVGMPCSSCIATVASALTAIRGVLADSIVVNLQATESDPVASHLPPQAIGEALFDINASELPSGTTDPRGFFKTKLEGLGFTVLDVEVTLAFPASKTASSLVIEPSSTRLKTDVYLAGLTCASCVQSLTNAFKSIPGIHSTEISLLPFQRAFFVHDPVIAPVQVILDTIENCGFEALHHSSSTVVEIDASVPLASLTAHDHSVTNSFLYIDGPGANAEEAQQAHLTTTKLDVSGMTCASCVASVERILLSLEGVDSATVSLLTNRAVVAHDSNIIGARRLIASIEDAGFIAGLAKEGDLTNLAQQQSQRELASYSRSALIAFCFALPAVILDMIIGMSLSPENPARQWVDAELFPGVSRLAGIMFLLASPVQFWLGMRFYVGAWRSLRYAGSANMDVLVALGTSAAYFYSVSILLASLIDALRTPGGGPTLSPQHQYFETSILLIFFILYGKYLETYAKQQTGAAVTQLLSLTPDTATLVHLASGESMQIEREEEVSVGLLEVGDILKVPVGSRFPCDAMVVSGTAFVDESMLTGEPVPLTKTVGDEVTGGTLNSGGGAVLVKAVCIGAETVLQRIVTCVQDAQMFKAPVQEVADRVSRVFVPVVVAAAVVTFLVWSLVLGEGWVAIGEGEGLVGVAMQFAVAVLVIACPCALGLATPTAVMVGTGVAAKYGILVKGGGAALQMASQVSTIVFDKTGTLTLGKPTVTDSVVLVPNNASSPQDSVSVDMSESSEVTTLAVVKDDGPLRTEEDVWNLVAYVEGTSVHPLASAATAYATPRAGTGAGRTGVVGDGWTVEEVKEEAGMGLSCRVVKGGEVWMAYVGSRRWVVDVNECHDGAGGVLGKVDGWQGDGKTVVYVGLREQREKPRDGKLVCMMAVSDPVRESARETVEALQGMGIRVVMVTGDQMATARAVAREVGILEGDVVAGCLPMDKGVKVRELKEDRGVPGKGKVVAFAGDGINDSIALASADVGIALGGGSDIAIESASAVLLRSDLHDIVTLLKLSRTVLRRIYINMAGAFAYNVIGIPIAAGVLSWSGFVLDPWMAGLAMALSSVTVVTSSLALKLFRA
ncbi:serine/threonine protein kinase Ran1 [Podochytrium sp. JEL0797]|nr:serine/threonine protein kinase Ran1 [Podochytrium sp. JEL0797]